MPYDKTTIAISEAIRFETFTYDGGGCIPHQELNKFSVVLYNIYIPLL